MCSYLLMKRHLYREIAWKTTNFSLGQESNGEVPKFYPNLQEMSSRTVRLWVLKAPDKIFIRSFLL